jgi:sugar/nucleoside kinase (ribokinase family)
MNSTEKTPPTQIGSVFVGFDGFVDETVDFVFRRLSATSYETFSSLKEFGQAIEATSGKSGHFEWVTKEIRMGGNAPLLAQALIQQGVKVHFAGCCGTIPSFESTSIQNEFQSSHLSIFRSLEESTASFLSLGIPGYTQLAELKDGKIFFGKTTNLADVTPTKLLTLRPELEWVTILDSVTAIAMVNWSMLPNMTDIWQWLLELPLNPESSQKILFIDLADPKKRPREDILKALTLLQKLQKKFTVILSLNYSEALLVSSLFDLQWDSGLSETQQLLEACNIYGLVVHSKEQVIGTTQQEAVKMQVEALKSPRRITGAGDNFNAGFLRKFIETKALHPSIQHAIWTAQEFVKTGVSPCLM